MREQTPASKSNWLMAVNFLIALLTVSCGATSDYRGYKNAPYSIGGVRYFPLDVNDALDFQETGIASWYDEGGFFGVGRGDTALGEPYRGGARAGAHKTLPLPCRVKVTNLENGRSIKLRLNDRGPFVGDRIIDVTKGAAKELGFREHGLARVRVEVLSVGDGKYEVKPSRGSRLGIF